MQTEIKRKAYGWRSLVRPPLRIQVPDPRQTQHSVRLQFRTPDNVPYRLATCDSSCEYLLPGYFLRCATPDTIFVHLVPYCYHSSASSRPTSFNVLRWRKAISQLPSFGIVVRSGGKEHCRQPYCIRCCSFIA